MVIRWAHSGRCGSFLAPFLTGRTHLVSPTRCNPTSHLFCAHTRVAAEKHVTLQSLILYISHHLSQLNPICLSCPHSRTLLALTFPQTLNTSFSRPTPQLKALLLVSQGKRSNRKELSAALTTSPPASLYLTLYTLFSPLPVRKSPQFSPRAKGPALRYDCSNCTHSLFTVKSPVLAYCHQHANKRLFIPSLQPSHVQALSWPPYPSNYCPLFLFQFLSRKSP